MSDPIPGWYPDPEEPSRQRFWDGTQWTEARSYPAGALNADGTPAPQPDAPPQQRSWAMVLLIVLIALLVLAALYWFVLKPSDTTETPVDPAVPTAPAVPTTPATPTQPPPTTPTAVPTTPTSVPTPPVPTP